jgi:hypothetical protein
VVTLLLKTHELLGREIPLQIFAQMSFRRFRMHAGVAFRLIPRLQPRENKETDCVSDHAHIASNRRRNNAIARNVRTTRKCLFKFDR